MWSFCGLESGQATICNETEWHQIFIVETETSKVVASALEQFEADSGVSTTHPIGNYLVSFPNLGPSNLMVYHNFLYYIPFLVPESFRLKNLKIGLPLADVGQYISSSPLQRCDRKKCNTTLPQRN